MGNKKTAAAAIVVGVGVLAIGANAAANSIINNLKFDIGIPQLDYDEFSNGYIGLDLPITVTNNNSIPISIKYFYGVLKYQGIKIANLNFPIGFDLPSLGVKTIQLDINIPLVSIMNDLVQAFTSGDLLGFLEDFDGLYLDGTLQIYGNITGIPITFTNLKIPL